MFILLSEWGLLLEEVIAEIDEVVGRGNFLLFEVLDGSTNFFDEVLDAFHHLWDHSVCSLFIGFLTIHLAYDE